MILLIIVLTSFAFSVIINKGLSGIKNKEINGFSFVIIGFIIQILIFNEKFANSSYKNYTPFLYVVSLFIIFAFMIMNFKRYLGIKIMSLGFILNILVIVANGGFMPQQIDLLIKSGQLEKVKMLKTYGHFYNAILMNEHTHLNMLGDRILLSLFGKFKTVYSIGDIIIMVGVAIFIYELFKKPAEKTKSAGHIKA
ncbi:MAG: DUF5317 domain-containing protein [Caldisericaceae bacterium]|nr:DUF5317 domain-containing protein [Caldisericaceae bacterium]